MIANWKTGPMNARFEAATGPSLTVPDAVLDIKTIVARFVSGQAVTVIPGGVYDEKFPEGFENLDSMEKLEMSRQIEEGISDIRDRVQRRQRATELKKMQPPAKADSASGLLDAPIPTETKPGS